VYLPHSGLRKQTTLFRVPLSTYLCILPSQDFGNKLRWFYSLYRRSPVRLLETNCVGSSPAIGIILYLAQSGLRKQTTLFRFPLSAYFSMLPIKAFGNKLRWFESLYRRVSQCSQFRPSETNCVGSIPSIGVFLYVANSGFRKQTTSVRVPLSAYFCIWPS
jgi:hypothetical protein